MRPLLPVLVAVAALAAATAAAADDSSHEDCRVRICDAGSEQFTAQDVEAEVRVGREVAARVLGRLPLHRDAALNRYVSLVGRSLALYAGRAEIEYHFAVVESEEVNAYSTPGGYVFVTRGAIDAMADEAELAGVLGHEISHVCARHLVKELNIRGNETDVVGGVVSLLSAGAGSATVAFLQAVEGAVDILFEQGYRIEDELEADRGAVLLTSSVGYDPVALARFLKRLRAGRDEEERAAASYPTTDERIAEIQRWTEPERSETPSKLLAERFAAHVGTR